MSDSTDPRSGTVVKRTPIVNWSQEVLQEHYHQQSASTLLNTETPMGRVDLFTNQFQSILEQQAAQGVKDPPKRGM